ncbi:hypothetical protein CKM354_001110400 [Cercospora kikuchii]|uniref:Uncharacterized protein n=1 Tax=Cercospora kikuchii TaxID=84275 RepID=A0A9P3FKX0_9PEZI|nr:uncharacterized protein CKM354_001110400 [Cercospora kikuchii]GIZ48029.1 hypothetical protein CKM354_001110400 [Cercospora kikuchii]
MAGLSASRASTDSKTNVHSTSRTSPRPGTPTTQTSEAPTLIRQFPKEPKFLETNRDKTCGSEAAQWRQNFVKVIEEHTQDMTIEERTEFFEACVARNKERYIQTFAAYYGKHPGHIPDRPGGVKSEKQREEGMRENEKILEKQKVLFKDSWSSKADEENNTTPFDTKRSFIPDTVAGPRDEADPAAEAPRCKHCIKQARKNKFRNPMDSLRKACGMKPRAKSGVFHSTASHAVPLHNGGAKSTTTASSASSAKGEFGTNSGKSSLKQLPTARRGAAHDGFLPPTQPAQHVEQRA